MADEPVGETGTPHYVNPVALADTVADAARDLLRAKTDAERLEVADRIEAAQRAYDDGIEAMAVQLGAKRRPACENCGSRIDVAFIPDPECNGVHAWYACRPCRNPAFCQPYTRGERASERMCCGSRSSV